MPTVKIVEQVMKANDQIAAQNQQTLDAHKTVGVNIMASPGAGKTSLLMRTVEELRGKLRIGAIEGDTASQVDADKVAAGGTPVTWCRSAAPRRRSRESPAWRSGLPPRPADRTGTST